MNQISASEKAVFEVGTGDVSILNGQFQKVSIEAGVGDAVFSGSVSNKLEVEAGTGDVNVSLTGTEKSYAFDLSAGLGEIRLNGRSKGAFQITLEFRIDEKKQFVEFSVTDTGCGIPANNF